MVHRRKNQDKSEQRRLLMKKPPSTLLMSAIIGGILAPVIMTGCAVGPNYHRPAVQTPTAYRDLKDDKQAQAQAASFADLPWWQVFQDPQLQELIRTALKENYDLQLATERITAARAQVVITRSRLFPQVQGNANFNGGKDGNTQSKFNFLGLTADAAFQLDLFGRLRRATEASRAELLATQDAKNTVTLTLVSDVASDYFQLLDLDLQLQITRDTVKTQEESVKLTRLRLDHGVATKLDVLQAQQVLDTANAQIPDLERQIGQEEDAISILLGHYPDGVPRGRPLAEQPLPPEVPPGMPSSLLERRPDIRQVEHDLVAANAEIGVARAAFFPADLPHRLRRRRVRPKQSLLRPHEFTDWSLVLWRPSHSANFHGRRSPRESETGGVATSAGTDRISASHSVGVSRCLRCTDRLSEDS